MELIILENLFLQFLHLILSEVEKIHLLEYKYLGFLINIKYEPIYRTLNKQTNFRERHEHQLAYKIHGCGQD